MFRSPGTSSSPDLASLVRKAKERGGIIGSLPEDGLPEFRLDKSAAPDDPSQRPSSSHASHHLSPDPSAAQSLRPSSSSSSLYSFVSSPSGHSTVTGRPSTEETLELSPSPSPQNVVRSAQAKTAKAEKVLGVVGGFSTSPNGSPTQPSSRTLGREGGKVRHPFIPVSVDSL